MSLDQLKLDGAKFAGLGKDFRRNGHLADVVQMAGDLQSLLPTRVEPEFGADGDGDLRHSPLVAGGIRVAHFADDCGYLNGAHERGFQLLEVTLDFLLGALFLRDVLQQADDCGPAVVGRTRAM